MADLTEAGRDLREHFDVEIPPIAEVRRRAAKSHRRLGAAAAAAVSLLLLGVVTIVGLTHGGQQPTRVVTGAPSDSGIGQIVLRPVDCELSPAYRAAVSRVVSHAVCASSPVSIPTVPQGAASASSAVVLPALGTSNLFVLGPTDDTVGPRSKVRVVPTSSGGFDVGIQLPGPLRAILLPDIKSTLRQASPDRTEEAIVGQGKVLGVIELAISAQPTGTVYVTAPPGGSFTRQAAEQLVRLIDSSGPHG